MRGTAVLALVALAAVARAAPVSPACTLLSADEAVAIVGADPAIADGGPVMAGVTACAWSGAGNNPVLTVQIIGAAAFASAGTDAAAYYHGLVQGMAAGGQPGEDLPGIGELAHLATASESFTLTALKGDKVITISALGLAREALLSAATTIAGRV